MFGRTDSDSLKSNPIDVYKTDEFSDYNKDVRQPSTFKKILNLGQKALDQDKQSGETTSNNPWPEESGSERYVPAERMANHDTPENEKPSLIRIYPEQQETKVLRPASGIITGHTDNPEPAPWEKGAMLPGQDSREIPVSSYEKSGETPADIDVQVEPAKADPAYRVLS